MSGRQKTAFLIVSCVFFLVVVWLVAMLQGVSRPLAQSTPSDFALHTPTPTPTPREETIDVPLGIGIWDSSDVDFFNRYAREQDVVGARTHLMHLLADAEIGQRMIVLGPHDEPITEDSAVLSAAKEMGSTILGYNLETATDKEQLVSSEMRMQDIASKNGLFYCFGPTLLKLTKHYEDFARHADCLVLQSQRYQTADEYEQVVEDLIERIRSANPEAKVWVQVSANPPDKPEVSVDEVIHDIQLIADEADLVWIFFQPNRASVAEEVFRRLRQ